VLSAYIGNSSKGIPGEITSIYENGIGVMCKDKEIVITKLKPNGKNEMNAKDFINGHKKENLKGRVLNNG
jgi:methionyl-tRNA formyltransferase